MNQFEQEITEIAKISRKKKEPTKRWLHRLARAADSFEDSDWTKLTTAAQTWVNGAIQAINDKVALPEFPEPETKASNKKSKKKKKKPEPEDEDSDDVEVPYKKRLKREASKKKVSKKKKSKVKKATPKKREVRKEGKHWEFRKAMLTGNGMDLTRDQIVQLLEKKKGLKISLNTAMHVFYETKQTLAMLDDLGLYTHK